MEADGAVIDTGTLFIAPGLQDLPAAAAAGPGKMNPGERMAGDKIATVAVFRKFRGGEGSACDSAG